MRTGGNLTHRRSTSLHLVSRSDRKAKSLQLSMAATSFPSCCLEVWSASEAVLSRIRWGHSARVSITFPYAEVVLSSNHFSPQTSQLASCLQICLQVLAVLARILHWSISSSPLLRSSLSLTVKDGVHRLLFEHESNCLVLGGFGALRSHPLSALQYLSK